MPAKQEKTVTEKFQDQIAASKRFVKSCEKPKKAEWKKLALATSVGMLVVGFSGYVIKAISYPIFTRLGGMSNIIEE
ncbi:Protein_translocase SEC61 complex gamma [Hexamita inflata]|uniref:Protein translocase SEC61 complex gamma n=1 Tax=Hexamita inflata TaxID=28002 RepID=A0AA86UBM4_9EUKA|nr:Protein translocase SEC61 complex gamma [Hexamita inflata]CAI9938843.1 Protein translocase SEC61 complex gamma [Hexamita inflata]CAI9948599.1 Protein translocase SEC61 complex gamma [Hexamita inflata]CAI9949239.1 Protein translocase SEC61 complex gamma [Hexamita inflata]